jgi:hypothetical protein
LSNGKKVNIGKTIKDGFKSSVVSIKTSLLKKDSLTNIKTERYSDKLNIPGIMKATATTFIDYSNWLSNQSGIVKTSKKAIDYLLSLNNNIKEKIVSITNLRKEIGSNINNIPNELENNVREIVQEEIQTADLTVATEPQPTTVINNPIKEIQTTVN